MTGTFMASESNFMVCIHCMTYNQSSYITDALNGFAMQKTDFPFVALVFDDASTDGEQGVIKKYLEEHFDHFVETGYKEWETEDANYTYARHKSNENCFFVVALLKKNLYRNPKKGELIKAWDERAKYIAICEGDDYWTDPLKLQKQVDFMEKHEDYSMCCTAFSQTFEGKEDEKSNVIYDLDEITMSEILREHWIGTLTTLYRYDVIADYRPPFRNLPFGDLPLWCHLSVNGRINYIRDITANYRSLALSACHFKNEKLQYEFSLEAMRVREFYAKKTNKTKIAQPFFSRKSHYFLDKCFKNKWFDFPLQSLWHFVKDYGNPSGYDRLKYWGLKNKYNYAIIRLILKLMGKDIVK